MHETNVNSNKTLQLLNDGPYLKIRLKLICTNCGYICLSVCLPACLSASLSVCLCDCSSVSLSPIITIKSSLSLSLFLSGNVLSCMDKLHHAWTNFTMQTRAQSWTNVPRPCLFLLIETLALSVLTDRQTDRRTMYGQRLWYRLGTFCCSIIWIEILIDSLQIKTLINSSKNFRIR